MKSELVSSNSLVTLQYHSLDHETLYTHSRNEKAVTMGTRSYPSEADTQRSHEINNEVLTSTCHGLAEGYSLKDIWTMDVVTLRL